MQNEDEDTTSYDTEYELPNKARLKRERAAYESAEYGIEDEE